MRFALRFAASICTSHVCLHWPPLKAAFKRAAELLRPLQVAACDNQELRIECSDDYLIEVLKIERTTKDFEHASAVCNKLGGASDVHKQQLPSADPSTRTQTPANNANTSATSGNQALTVGGGVQADVDCKRQSDDDLPDDQNQVLTAENELHNAVFRVCQSKQSCSFDTSSLLFVNSSNSKLQSEQQTLKVRSKRSLTNERVYATISARLFAHDSQQQLQQTRARYKDAASHILYAETRKSKPVKPRRLARRALADYATPANGESAKVAHSANSFGLAQQAGRSLCNSGKTAPDKRSDKSRKPKQRQLLEIVYKCKTRKFRKFTACSGKKFELTCNTNNNSSQQHQQQANSSASDLRLLILAANFGFFSSDAKSNDRCAANRASQAPSQSYARLDTSQNNATLLASTDCESALAWPLLANACHMRTSCTFNVEQASFGPLTCASQQPQSALHQQQQLQLQQQQQLSIASGANYSPLYLKMIYICMNASLINEAALNFVPKPFDIPAPGRQNSSSLMGLSHNSLALNDNNARNNARSELGAKKGASSSISRELQTATTAKPLLASRVLVVDTYNDSPAANNSSQTDSASTSDVYISPNDAQAVLEAGSPQLASDFSLLDNLALFEKFTLTDNATATYTRQHTKAVVARNASHATSNLWTLTRLHPALVANSINLLAVLVASTSSLALFVTLLVCMKRRSHRQAASAQGPVDPRLKKKSADSQRAKLNSASSSSSTSSSSSSSCAFASSSMSSNIDEACGFGALTAKQPHSPSFTNKSAAAKMISLRNSSSTTNFGPQAAFHPFSITALSPDSNISNALTDLQPQHLFSSHSHDRHFFDSNATRGHELGLQVRGLQLANQPAAISPSGKLPSPPPVYSSSNPSATAFRSNQPCKQPHQFLATTNQFNLLPMPTDLMLSALDDEDFCDGPDEQLVFRYNSTTNATAPQNLAATQLSKPSQHQTSQLPPTFNVPNVVGAATLNRSSSFLPQSSLIGASTKIARTLGKHPSNPHSSTTRRRNLQRTWRQQQFSLELLEARAQIFQYTFTDFLTHAN